ncbi:MAG: ParB/RepB/Spo0J family partition protein, partial [Nitratireductor sp.]
DLGNAIGKSRSHVANTLRLLKLSSKVQTLVTGGQLSAGHARALITSTTADELAERIIKEGLSVRQIEMLVQKQLEEPSNTKSGETKTLEFKSADIKALEQQIEDQLGLKIDIRNKPNNKGEIRVKYKSLEQLEEVCTRLSDN